MNTKYQIPNTNSQRGAAVITAVMFFVIIGVVLAAGLSSPVVREYKTARDFDRSKSAYYLTEAGAEDAFYRVRKNLAIDSQEILSLSGNTATTTINTVTGTEKSISSIGDIFTNTRRVKSTLTTSSGAAFSYGVQVGAGGVIMSGSSTISGSLYSAGPVSGTNSNNLIKGTVISGGTNGLNGSITDIYNQDGASMYAGTISSSVISAGGKAYCNTISGSSTTTCQSLSPQLAQPYSISDQQIADWEASAVAGGTVACTSGAYEITTDITIGNKKIPCDFKITGSGQGAGPTITLTGPIWVTGNITIKNYMTVKVDPSYSGQTVAIIADAVTPATRMTSNNIKIESNSPLFQGAPGGNSWIMFVSMNTGASNGNPTEAIELSNGANGDILLFSPYGDVKLEGQSDVKEVVAYKLTLSSQANVSYASGLTNVLFTSGPTGAWYIQDWKEGQ